MDKTQQDKIIAIHHLECLCLVQENKQIAIIVNQIQKF